MCNNPCNCAAIFERLNGEIQSIKNLLISIHTMVTQHLMKKEDILEEIHCMKILKKQVVESSIKS